MVDPLSHSSSYSIPSHRLHTDRRNGTSPAGNYAGLLWLHIAENKAGAMDRRGRRIGLVNAITTLRTKIEMAQQQELKREGLDGTKNAMTAEVRVWSWRKGEGG